MCLPWFIHQTPPVVPFSKQQINKRLFHQCIERHDEGPVRQLRRAEDDRRRGARPAQDPHAQDPPPPGQSAQVHLRQAHHRQAREVLHEDRLGDRGLRLQRDLQRRRRFGPHRTSGLGRRVRAHRDPTIRASLVNETTCRKERES